MQRSSLPGRLLTAGILALCAGVCHADPGIVYVGAGLTRDELSHFLLSVNPENTRGYPDISATSWKAFAGLRPYRMLAIEGDYYNTADSTRYFSGPGVLSARSEASAFAGYAVGLIPLQTLPAEFFGKIGFDRWKLRAGGTIAGGESETGTGLAGGVGIQWHAGRIGARLEYEWLKMGLTNGLGVASLAVTVNLY